MKPFFAAVAVIVLATLSILFADEPTPPAESTTLPAGELSDRLKSSLEQQVKNIASLKARLATMPADQFTDRLKSIVEQEERDIAKLVQTRPATTLLAEELLFDRLKSSLEQHENYVASLKEIRSTLEQEEKRYAILKAENENNSARFKSNVTFLEQELANLKAQTAMSKPASQPSEKP